MLRLTLTLESFVLVIGYASAYGGKWLHMSWAYKTMTIGLLGVFLYLFAGQFKARLLHIEFDVFSWIGLVSVLVADVGLCGVLRSQRRRDRR
jgi:hypothetical protein